MINEELRVTNKQIQQFYLKANPHPQVTDGKLYKLKHKKGNHPNKKINEDGSKSAIQFTEDNVLDGPLDYIEASDEEIIRMANELLEDKRTLGEAIWQDVIAPASREAINGILQKGYRYFEKWMEEDAIPAAKVKSKQIFQNAGEVFSGIRASIRGEEPKIVAIMNEKEKQEDIDLSNSSVQKMDDDSEKGKIVISQEEAEMLIALIKQEAERLVVHINLLRNAVVFDPSLGKEEKNKLQNKLEALTTSEIVGRIDLLLENKNRGLLDTMSLQTLKAFRQGKFLIDGQEVPISNYIESR